MDGHSLQDYYEWSHEANALLIVRDIEGRVAGAQYLTVQPGYITIEMLTRNKLLEYPGAGGELVRVVERVPAPQLGVTEIRMEALQHVVDYYDDTLGYEERAAPYQRWRMGSAYS